MSPDEAELVWLPEIKFTELKRDEIVNGVGKGGPANQCVCPDPKPHQRGTVSLEQPEAYERVSSDKLGEELKADGAIWELYRNEAREFDHEFVNLRHKRLDMMLLFAGLFSSVLTGFVVESTKLLQQDPADASLDILLFIAQSQQRIESGAPQPRAPTVSRPEFTIPASARWINGLWFLSLIISLTGALLAMIAREWLLAFTSSRPRSPHAFALLHQARLGGMYQWHAIHIIDLLPTILQCALFLFAFGLVIYLWTLDYIVAVLVAIISGAAFIFYAATTLLVAVSDFCPFVTHASRYIQRRLRVRDWIAHAEGMSKSAVESQATTIKELRALKWLAENARDPTVGECTHQALAGLRTGVAHESQLDSSNSESKPDPMTKIREKIIQSSDSKDMHEFLHRMFDDVCNKLPQLLKGRSKLTASGGLTLSKYANALPPLAQRLGPWHICSRQSSWNETSNKNEQSSQGPKSMEDAPIRLALDSLDSTWETDAPYLTADTRALLTIAELRLIVNAARSFDSRGDSSPSQISKLPQSESEHPPSQPHTTYDSPALDHRKDTSETTAINMDDLEKQDELLEQTSDVSDLFDLRARYSRVLFRTGVQLSNDSTKNAIKPSILKDLMLCIKDAFSCESLNPPSSISTHHQQTEGGKLPTFCAMLIGSNACIMLSPTAIGKEYSLLHVLLRIVGQRRMRDSPDLTMATRSAFKVVVPVLLKQWFAVVSQNTPSGVEGHEVITKALDAWSDLKSEKVEAHVDTREITTMGRLIIIAQSSISLIKHEHPGIGQLATIALQALWEMTDGAYGRFHLQTTFQVHHDLFEQLIQAANANLHRLDSDTLNYLQKLLRPRPDTFKDPIPQSFNGHSSALICRRGKCPVQILNICTWGQSTSRLQRFMKRQEESEVSAGCSLEQLFTSEYLVDILSAKPDADNTELEACGEALGDYLIHLIVSAFRPETEKSLLPGNPYSRNYFSTLLEATKLGIKCLLIRQNDPRCPEFIAAIISAVKILPPNLRNSDDLAALFPNLRTIVSNSTIIHPTILGDFRDMVRKPTLGEVLSSC